MSDTVALKSARVVCHESGIAKWEFLYKYAHTWATSASAQMSPTGSFSNNSLSVAVAFKTTFCLMHCRGWSFTFRHTRSRWWPRPAGYALQWIQEKPHRNYFVARVPTHFASKCLSFPQTVLHLSSLHICLRDWGMHGPPNAKINRPRRVVSSVRRSFCSLVRVPWSWVYNNIH